MKVLATEPCETRHYIALTDMGRVHMKLGPGHPDHFSHGPTEPVSMGETWAYPGRPDLEPSS